MDKVTKDELKPVYEMAGKNLKKLREERGLRQEDLAKKIGLSPGLISRIERGEASLAPRHIAKICKIYGLQPGYFYRTDDDRNIETAKALLRNSGDIKDDKLAAEILKDLQAFMGYLETKYGSEKKTPDK